MTPASTLLTLIVDKKGIFAPSLVKSIHEDQTTVVATATKDALLGNAIIIPYEKTIPEIPEGNYTHMFFVWDGKSETLHLLEPLLQKASQDYAQFVFVTDYRFYSEKLIRFIRQEYSRASIIFTGDIFGHDQYHSVVTAFFTEAQEKGAIRLEQVGLKHIYPVEFDDVVAQILKVGFGGEKGKIYLACQQYGMTELSLVHILQKVDPLIKIDFKKEEKEQTFLSEGEYLFDNHYDVTRKIQNAYAEFVARKKGKQPTPTESFFSPVAIQQEKVVKKSRKKKWIAAVVVGMLLLFSPVLLTLVYAGLGEVLLYGAGNSFKTGQYKQVEQFSQTAGGLFATAASTNEYAGKELHLVLLGGLADHLTGALDSGSLFAALLTDTGEAVSNFSRVAKGTSVSPSSDFLSGLQSIKNMLFTLTNAHDVPVVAGISLEQITKPLSPLGSVLDELPVLFGFPENKTYLVIFQNNMELRPGGGFIGSYGLVTLDQGKVVKFVIHNVYDADGQLKGHVEPPYVLRRYIPQIHWYLRDSNFDVDFSQDSANAAFFLSQETGEKVDGVIGVDLTFVKDVLAAIGPVYVTEYNEQVSSDNLFLLTETHAEKHSFAGSTQKQDFLTALFAAMQKKIATGSIASPKAIVDLLGAVSSKDVVFGFSDPLIQDVFTVNGLSSTLWDGRKAGSGIINDITGINEANIGVDKANYFLTRSVRQDMAIGKDGSVSGRLAITYTNTSHGNAWPGGDYKNYVRLILPQGATLQSVQIDGTTQSIVPAVTDFNIYEAKGFTPPKGLEVDNNTENGKALFGFVTTIKAGSTQKIVVTYALSKVDPSSPTLIYSGWLFKEPGVDAYPYDFTLTVPSNFSLLQKPSWVQGSGSSISFSKSFGEDTQFSVSFSQK